VSILFIIVFGIIGVISGAFGYYMGDIELFFIVFGAFILYSVINKYKKWVIVFVVILMSVGVGVVIYYYRNENLDVFMNPIQDFINTYYYSVILDGYYISHGYQAILIAFISLLLFYLYHFFYRRKKLQWMPIIVGFIFVIAAFLSDTLTTSKDHRSFLYFLMSSVIYYFAVYSSRNVTDIRRRHRYTFYGMGIIFALGIIGFGMFFNHYRPNPFEKKAQSTTVSSNMLEDNNESREYERSVVQDIWDGSYQVQSSFEHEGIAVFSVDADILKYYVTDVYDIYEEGVWRQSRDELLTPSIEYDEALYERETVEIIYENIITNRLLLSPHWDAINISEEMQSLAAENGILERGFNYTIDAVIPRYRTIAWQEAIEQKSNGQSIEGFMQIPDGFDRLQELAQEVTEGASTDYEKGRRIEAYLSSEYLYNEAPEYGSTDDMIHAFLFETQEGFCQQFASSMVMMMRSVGIPSRFVVGYVLDIESYDDIPDSLMYAYGEVPEEKTIYDHNAHAWVESYFPGIGWVQFEPTAGQSFYSFFDPQASERQTEEETASASVTFVNRDDILFWGLSAIGILLVLSLIAMLLKRRHSNRKNYIKRIYLDYHILLLYLNECTMEKQQGETIREYGKRIQEEIPLSQVRFKDFLETLEKAFYNRKVPEIEQIQILEKYITLIKKVAKRRMHFWSYQKNRIVEMMTYFR